MNEQPVVFSPKRDYFKIIAIVCIAALAIAAGWLVYVMQGVSDKQAALAATVAKLDKNIDAEVGVPDSNTGWNTVVKSGKGGFHITLPDGWGPVINDIQGDHLIMLGTAQPTVAKGSKVVVTESKGYGSDSFSLFSVVLLKKGEAAAPQGTPAEFVVGKAEEAIKGTKYTYIYPKDDIVGIGHTRFQGDRDYEYVLPFGDNELHVYYSVVGSDPRNLVDIVDEITRTVILSNPSPATR